MYRSKKLLAIIFLVFYAVGWTQTGNLVDQNAERIVAMIDVRNSDALIMNRGAGLILGQVDDRILIATANHVVRDPIGEVVNVRFVIDDLREFEADVLEIYDPNLDVAFLAVDKPSDINIRGLSAYMDPGDASLKVNPSEASLTSTSNFTVGYSGGFPWLRSSSEMRIVDINEVYLRVSGLLASGDSGGGFFDQYGSLLGMNLRGNSPPFIVLRMDVIDQLLKDWGITVSALNTPDDTLAAQEELPGLFEPCCISAGEIVVGDLSENPIKEYTFQGFANTPLVFEIQDESESISTTASVIDKVGRELFSASLSSGQSITYNPLEDDDYTLKLDYYSGQGDYQLSMNYFSGPPETRNIVKPLGAGDDFRGNLVPGAYDEYSIQGRANTPLLFSLTTEESNVQIQLVILDRFGRKIEGVIHQRDTLIHPFTPEKDGELFVRLEGYSGRGSYLFNMDYAAPPETRNVTTPIDPEALISSTLARQARNVYSFQGHPNTPIKFVVVPNSGDLKMNLFIEDEIGTEIFRIDNGRGFDFGFTPTENQVYNLTLEGVSGVGDYRMLSEYISGGPETRNILNRIEVDDGATGMLAIGAFDEYIFPGAAGIELNISVLRQGDLELYFDILITDAEGTEVLSDTSNSSFETSFTPELNSDYVIKVQGSRNYGDYLLIIEAP